ncbi:MAG: multiprotein bridging factor aMBF1 [Promethearchaeota archaeon]|jgi:putative transcription factor
MPKYSNIDKECPVCGGIIWGKGQKVLLEGAKITVCDNCAQHGTKITRPTTVYRAKKVYQKRPQSTTRKHIVKPERIEELEIVSDYAKKIRNARNNRGLNQDQFAQKLNEKPSLLRRIEAGKVEPTIKLSKKIEKIYDIKLLKSTDEIEFNSKDQKFMKKSTGASLGDIAFVKRKENHSDS